MEWYAILYVLWLCCVSTPVVHGQVCSISSSITKDAGTVQDRASPSGGYGASVECHWQITSLEPDTVVQLTFDLLNLVRNQGNNNDVLLVNLGGKRPGSTVPNGWKSYTRHDVAAGTDDIGTWNYTSSNALANVCPTTAFDPTTTDLTTGSLLTDPSRNLTWIYFTGEYKPNSDDPMTLTSSASDVYIIFRTFVQGAASSTDKTTYGFLLRYKFVSSFCASAMVVSPRLTVSEAMTTSRSYIIQDNLVGQMQSNVTCIWRIQPTRDDDDTGGQASMDAIWLTFTSFDLQGDSSLAILNGASEEADVIAAYDVNSVPQGVVITTQGAAYVVLSTDANARSKGFTLSWSATYCPHKCSGPSHGVCQYGHCLCAKGWSGTSCSVPEGWFCRDIHYNASDGCDCGCGLYDPDCDKNEGHSEAKSCTSSMPPVDYSGSQGKLATGECLYCSLPSSLPALQTLPAIAWDKGSIEQSCPLNSHCPTGTQCTSNGKCVAVVPSLSNVLRQQCVDASDCPESTVCNAQTSHCEAPDDMGLSLSSPSTVCSLAGLTNTTALIGWTVELRIRIGSPQATDTILTYPGLTIAQTSSLAISVSTLPVWNTHVNIADGQWHELAWVWDNVQGTMSLYSGQTLVASTAVPPNAAPLVPDQSITFGPAEATLGYLRISSVAKAISSLFVSTTPSDRPDLVAEYHFDQGSARDLSANQNDLTGSPSLVVSPPESYPCLAHPVDISTDFVPGTVVSVVGTVLTGSWSLGIKAVNQVKLLEVVASSGSPIRVLVDSVSVASLTVAVLANSTVRIRLQKLSSTSMEICVNDISCVQVTPSSTPPASVYVASGGLSRICVTKASSLATLAALVSKPTVTVDDRQACSFPFEMPMRDCEAFQTYLTSKQYDVATFLPLAKAFAYATLDKQSQVCLCDIMPSWNNSIAIVTRVNSTSSPVVTVQVSYNTIKTQTASSGPPPSSKCASQCYFSENKIPGMAPGGPPNGTIVSGANAKTYTITREFYLQKDANNTWQVVGASSPAAVRTQRCAIEGPDAALVESSVSALSCQTSGGSDLEPPSAQPYCILNNVKRSCLADVNSCGLDNGQMLWTTPRGSFDDGYDASITGGVHQCMFRIQPQVHPALAPYAVLTYFTPKNQLGQNDVLVLANSKNQIVDSFLGPSWTPEPTTILENAVAFNFTSMGDKTGVDGDGFVVDYETTYVYPALSTSHFCSNAVSTLSFADSIVFPTYNFDKSNVLPLVRKCDFVVESTDASSVVWLQFLDLTLTSDRVELYDLHANSSTSLLATVSTTSDSIDHWGVGFNGITDYIVTQEPVRTPTTIMFWIKVGHSLTGDCSVANACVNGVPKTMKVLGSDNQLPGFNIVLALDTGGLSVQFNTGTTYTLQVDVRRDSWRHIAIVRRKADVFGYIDGAPVTVVASPGQTIPTTLSRQRGVLFMGGQPTLPDATNVYFKGLLRHVILFSESKTVFDIRRQMRLPCDQSDGSLMHCYTFASPEVRLDSGLVQNHLNFHGTLISRQDAVLKSETTRKTFTASSSRLLLRFISRDPESGDHFRFVAWSKSCPEPCFGRCDRGRCLCDPGLSGHHCNITTPACSGHVLLPEGFGTFVLPPAATAAVVNNHFVPDISKPLGYGPLDCSWHLRKSNAAVVLEFEVMDLDTTDVLSVYDGDREVPVYSSAYNLTADVAMARAAFLSRGLVQYTQVVFQSFTPTSAVATLWPTTFNASACSRTYHVVEFERGRVCADAAVVGLSREVAGDVVSKYWWTESAHAFESALVPSHLYFNQFDQNAANITVEFKLRKLNGQTDAPYPALFRLRRRTDPTTICKDGSEAQLNDLSDQLASFSTMSRPNLDTYGYADKCLVTPIFRYAGKWTINPIQLYYGAFRSKFVLDQIPSQAFTIVVKATIVLTNKDQYIFSQENRLPGSIFLKYSPTTKASGVWIFGTYGQNNGVALTNPTSFTGETVHLAITVDSGIVTYFVNGLRHSSINTVAVYETCAAKGLGSCQPPILNFVDVNSRLVIGAAVTNGQGDEFWIGAIHLVEVYQTALSDAIVACLAGGVSSTVVQSTVINSISDDSTGATLSTIDITSVKVQSSTVVSRLVREWSLVRRACQVPPLSYQLDTASLQAILGVPQLTSVVWNNFDDTLARVSYQNGSTFSQSTLKRTKSYGFGLTNDLIVRLLVEYGRALEITPYHITKVFVNSITATSAVVSFTMTDVFLAPVDAKTILTSFNNSWQVPASVQRLKPPDFGIVPPTKCSSSANDTAFLEASSGYFSDGQPTETTTSTTNTLCTWEVRAPPSQSVLVQLDLFNVDCFEGRLLLVNMDTGTPTGLCGNLTSRTFSLGQNVRFVYTTGLARGPQALTSTGFYAKYWFSGHSFVQDTTDVTSTYSDWTVVDTVPTMGSSQCQVDPTAVPSTGNPWQVDSVRLVSTLNRTCYATQIQPPNISHWDVQSMDLSVGDTSCSQWEADESMPWTATNVQVSRTAGLDTVANPTVVTQSSAALELTTNSTLPILPFKSTKSSAEIRFQSRIGGRGRVVVKYSTPNVLYAAPPSYRPMDGNMGDGTFDAPLTATLSDVFENFLADGDVLRLFPGRYSGSGYCDLVLDKSVVVESISGADSTIIDCLGTFRGWQVAHLSGLTSITGITFTHCTVSSNLAGAALLITGRTLLHKCRFVDNHHVEGLGTVAVVAPSTSRIVECEFALNTGRSTLAVLSATATLLHSRFYSNSATSTEGVLYTNLADNDSLVRSLRNPSSVAMNNCTFLANTGYVTVGFESKTKATVTNCTFTENEGCAVRATASTLKFLGNVVKGNGDSGLYVAPEADVTSFWNLFESNRANSGGAVSISHGTTWTGSWNVYRSNHAKFSGGAMSGSPGTFAETNSQFLLNVAGPDVPTVDVAVKYHGGAMYFDLGNTIEVTNNVFRGNTATSGGGAIYLSANSALLQSNVFQSNSAEDGQGGAVMLHKCSQPTVRVEFQSNVFSSNAASKGGSIGLEGSDAVSLQGDAFSDGQAWLFGGAVYASTFSAIRMTNVSFTRDAADNGGAVYATTDSIVNMLNCSFDQCSSRFDGGCLYVVNRVLLDMTNVRIDHSSAEGNGGAIVAMSQRTQLYMSNVEIQNSQAKKGGAMYLIDCRITQGSVDGLRISHSIGHVMGGAIYAVLVDMTMSNLVTWNTSSVNGGMLSLEDCTATLSDSTIDMSTAVVNGGAIYAIVSALVLASTTIQNAVAANYGGGVYGFASTVRVMGGTVIWTSKSNFGGGMFASSSAVYLDSMAFVRNEAATGGGLCTDMSDVWSTKTTFDGNVASDMGGGGYISYNYIQLLDANITRNEARQGGGLYLTKLNSFRVQGSIFAQNRLKNDLRALGGGLAVIQLVGNASIASTTFDGNAGDDDTKGGALYADNTGVTSNATVVIHIDQARFVGNSAGAGGAVYLDAMQVTLNRSAFVANTALTGGGGGVYWQGSVEPALLQSQEYSLNQAIYGPNVASTPFALSPAYTAADGGGEASGQPLEGEFLVYVVDQYMQTVKTDNSVLVALQSATTGAFVTGVSQVVAEAGVCNFNGASVQQTPGRSITVTVSAPSLRPLANVTIPVRKCIRGEIIPLGISQCVRCTFGKFSWNTSDTICHECPTGAVCGGGDSVISLAGYWRFPNSTGVCPDSDLPYDNCKLNVCLGTSCGGYTAASHTATVRLDGPNNSFVLSLSTGEDAFAAYSIDDELFVVGKVVTVVGTSNDHVFVIGVSDLPTEGSINIYRPGNQTCDIGYMGNLCLQCAYGYTRSGKSACAACPANYTLTILVLIGGMIAVVVVVVVLIRMALNKAKKKSNLTSILTKIFTSYLQLIILAESFNVDWPKEVLAMFRVQGAVASPGDKLISISCLLDYYKSDVSYVAGLSPYYTQLILYLCLPVCGVVFPALYWTTRYRAIRLRQRSKDWVTSVPPGEKLVSVDHLSSLFESVGEKPSELVLLAMRAELNAAPQPVADVKAAYLRVVKGETKAKLVLSIIVIMFLIHPSLTNHLFQMFSCTQLGADADGTPLYFLNPDMDVACYTASHYRWMYLVGGPALVGFTLGIPVFAFYVVYSCRHKLDDLSTKLEYGFLYIGFRRKYFYWEIWVMFRKITVCFISVFLKSQGTGPQALAATVLVLLGMYVHMDCQPYEDKRVNRLEQMSLVTSLFTMFCALFLYQVEVVGASRVLFGAVVIAANALFGLQFSRLMAVALKEKAAVAMDRLAQFKPKLTAVEKFKSSRHSSETASRAKVYVDIGTTEGLKPPS